MSAKHENLWAEIREQNKKFKDMPPKKKLEYFWEYYKFPTLVIIFAIIILFSMIHSIRENSRETLLYAAFINGNSNLDYEPMEQAFADVLEADPEEVFVTIDASFQLASELTTQSDIAGTQKLMAMASVNQLDILSSDETTSAYMARNGYYADLRTVLPEDMLKKYEPYFVYYTHDPEAERARYEEAGIPNEEEDSLGPYETLEPVPYGISSDAFSPLVQDIFFGMDSVTGICISSQQVENAVSFLSFLETYELPESGTP